MRRSAIIFTTIVSMVLCVSLLAFSVYAHLTQTFSVSNTIGFSPADDVFVALECRISGASQTQLNNPPSGYDSVEDYLYAIGIYKDVEFDESMRRDPNYSLGEWQILESLEFASVSQPIIYTITIYNYSDMSIRVSITDYVDDSDSISNVISDPVVIPALANRNESPSSAQITLTTTVNNSTAGFTDVANDFTVVFETIA